MTWSNLLPDLWVENVTSWDRSQASIICRQSCGMTSSGLLTCIFMSPNMIRFPASGMMSSSSMTNWSMKTASLAVLILEGGG